LKLVFVEIKFLPPSSTGTSVTPCHSLSLSLWPPLQCFGVGVFVSLISLAPKNTAGDRNKNKKTRRTHNEKMQGAGGTSLDEFADVQLAHVNQVRGWFFISTSQKMI
jgi:hypothetical protein